MIINEFNSYKIDDHWSYGPLFEIHIKLEDQRLDSLS